MVKRNAPTKQANNPEAQTSGNFFREIFLTWKLTSPEFRKNAKFTIAAMTLVFLGACWAIQTAIRIAPVAGFFRDDKLAVKESKLKLDLIDYNVEDFSMKIPKGWEVERTGKNEGSVIYVHDKNDQRYGIFFQLQSKPLMRTYDERNIYQRYANADPEKYGIYSYAPVIRLGTVETFYGSFNAYTENIQSYLVEYADFHFPSLKEFKMTDTHNNITTLSSNAKDDTSLRGTFKTVADPTQFTDEVYGEGLFTGTIMSYEPSDVTGYYIVYGTTFITAPEDELIAVAPTLLEAVSSLKFSDDFSKKISKVKIWDEKAPNVNKLYDEVAQNLHKLWEERNQDYDIARQKWSDDHAETERVCLQDGSKCYRTFRGFKAGYKGNTYRPAEDGDYLKPLSGEIKLKD